MGGCAGQVEGAAARTAERSLKRGHQKSLDRMYRWELFGTFGCMDTRSSYTSPLLTSIPRTAGQRKDNTSMSNKYTICLGAENNTWFSRPMEQSTKVSFSMRQLEMEA